MSYTTLSSLSSSFSSAVGNTAGLDSYLMIDISELNANHNVDYPLCVVELPNSSIGNINKAWEEYEISCYILQVDDSSLSNIPQYDYCTTLFTNLLSSLMGQRQGSYSLDKESVSIERVRGVGNDNLIGVKVEFNLLIPSILAIEANAIPVAIPTNNLYAHFTPSSSSVSRTSSALSWVAASPNQSKIITHTSHGNKNIPYYSSTQEFFLFQGNIVSDTEQIVLNNTSFTNANFSIFMKVFIPNNSGEVSGSTLFHFPSGSDYVRVSVISDGIHEGKFQLAVSDSGGADNEALFTTDQTPLGSSSDYGTFGFVNDYTNSKSYIYINKLRFESSVFSDAVITSSNLHLGAYHIATDIDTNGFEGEMKNVAIYDGAVTVTEAETIVDYFNFD
tara:strand:+ start:427 stop:1596 length:1170 start_codon:yes stop_codon:yes gene_type:complete